MLRKEMFKNLAKAPNENDHILLLTYNDINGMAVGALLRRIYNNVTIEKCNNANMNNLILRTVSSPESNDFDFILISGIYCSKETAETVNEFAKKHRIVLLDNHESASWLNKYNWAVITAKLPDDGIKQTYDQTSTRNPVSMSGIVWDWLCFNRKNPIDYLPQ